MRNRLLLVNYLPAVARHECKPSNEISFASRLAGPKRNDGSASGGEYSQVIGSPVDSANGSNSYNGVDGGGGGDDDDESGPIDSRNVSGSDNDGGSDFEVEGRDDDDDDNDNDGGDDDGDDEDDDDGSGVCTRDEELSVPDDDDGSQSGSGYDSRSLSPSSGGSWGGGRPRVPPLDLR